MQNIEITIDAKDQTTKVYLALKRLKPDILLGPTLDLLRSGKPFQIETVRLDNEEQLIKVKAMIAEIEGLHVDYRMTFCEFIQEGDQFAWKQVPKTNADLDTAISKKKAWVADRQTSQEFLKNYRLPPRVPLVEKAGEIFHERWKRLGFENLLPEERDHVLVWSINAEVTNGGLDQYIYNSSGDEALETVQSLRRAGCFAIADVLERTLDALPEGWCADRDERIRRLEILTSNRPQIMEEFDDEYDKALEKDSEEKENKNMIIERIIEAYRREGIEI